MNDIAGILSRLVPDGGQAGIDFRSTDWARTALGAPDTWPEALKIVVAMVFRSEQPMVLLWGPEFIQMYNEAFRPSLGTPTGGPAMGVSARSYWAASWGHVGHRIEAALRSGESTWVEDALLPVYRNGRVEEGYWTYSYSAIPNVDGSIGGVLVLCTETTARMTEARHLEESRQALHAFLMRAPVGMCLLEGPQHVFTLANPEFMRLLFGGMPPEALLGKPVREAVPGIEGQGYTQILDAVYASGERYVGAKMRAVLRQKNGEEKEMFVNFAYEAIRDRSDAIKGVLAVLYEVTDQVNEEKETRRLAENLTTAITARDTFLGIASHELKTPLTALKLQSQTHLRTLERSGAESFTESKLQKVFSTVNLQTDRLARLVEDMLDVYRINAGKLSMAWETTDLSAVVAEVVDRLAPQFENNGSSIDFVAPPGIVAEIDVFRFEQVVTNLLVNALKHAPGAAVEVALAPARNEVVLSVRDHGPGIMPAHVERIFERFTRADHEDGAGGLGLGLYISREIVHAHRGRIDVETALGEGTTFVVHLPKAQ